MKNMYVVVAKAIGSIPAALESRPIVIRELSLSHLDKITELRKLEIVIRKPDAFP